MLRWGMGLLIAGLLTAAPFLYYRYVYTFSKRLRVVEPGLVYRSGSMTAPGFRDAVRRYHIKTIVNLQDEYSDPDISKGYFTSENIRETDLCREMGVRYVFIAPDLINRHQLEGRRPKAIDQFLKLMDNPDNYPVLLHCRAGLHRTGCLVAIYRMEYDGWSMEQALGELKAHGFGEFVSTRANDYILEYVVNYQPGWRSVAIRE